MPEHNAPPGWPAMSAGYRAGLRAMILALLLTVPLSVLGATPSPLEGVAERVMEWTPVALATPLLLGMGAWAKPLALLGAYAALLALGGVAGALAPPGLWRQGRLVVGLGRAALAVALLGLALLVVMPPLALWPVGLLIAVFAATEQGTVLLGQRGGANTETPRGKVRAREQALRDSAAMAGGAAVLLAVTWVAGPFYRQLRFRTAGGSLFPWQPPAPRDKAFTDVTGLAPEVSRATNAAVIGTDTFYVMSKNLDDPDLDLATWSVEVRGLVDHPLRLTAADLLTRPRRDQYVTLECVDNPPGGPLMSNALWSGVALRELLTQARLKPGARRVVFWATDGHVDSVPLEMATSEHALLAYGMNGSWLPRAHGFPLRALVPGLYGFKNVKWLSAVEVIGHDFLGHWQQRGWTQAATIHTTARIDTVRHLPDGRLLAAGVAFGGARGIASVRVRLNGGAWQPTRLHTPPLSPLSWVQWQTTLRLPPGYRGMATVTARATDGHGHPQEAASRQSYPDGAAGLHSVSVSI